MACRRALGSDENNQRISRKVLGIKVAEMREGFQLGDRGGEDLQAPAESLRKQYKQGHCEVG